MIQNDQTTNSGNRGNQYSTYRLQLPYRYSLPLIGMSIFLHWMMSNSFYIVVAEGGKTLPGSLILYLPTHLLMINLEEYFKSSLFNSVAVDDSLAPGMSIAFGYSGISILILICIFFVLLLGPILLGLLRLPGYMKVVGSNSRAISAACHVSPVSQALRQADAGNSKARKAKKKQWSIPRGSQGSKDDIEMWSLTLVNDDLEMHPTDTDEASTTGKYSLYDAEEDIRDRLAKSEIKWGEVKMPPEWYAQFARFNEQMGHLGFGVQEDHIDIPKNDNLYF
jgi:hypothetical protein